MGKYFIGNEPHRVTFEDGQWCDVKAEFTQTDLDYISNALMTVRTGRDEDGKDQSEAGISFGRLAMLERGIVAWSFTGDDNTPVPVSKDTVSSLRTKYRIVILKTLDRLQVEAQGFSKNSPTAST